MTLAFGNRVAKADDPVVIKATDASAFPTATSCVGGPDGVGSRFSERTRTLEHENPEPRTENPEPRTENPAPRTDKKSPFRKNVAIFFAYVQFL